MFTSFTCRVYLERPLTTQYITGIPFVKGMVKIWIVCIANTSNIINS